MNKFPKTIAFLLFFAGASLGLLLSLLFTWANVEANFYGFSRLASDRLPGLDCPVMLGRGETGSVSIRIVNDSEKSISPVTLTEVSTPALPAQSRDAFEVPAGETFTLTKTVGPENVDLGMFVFFKALVFSAYPIPNQEGVCGMFVLPIRGNGTGIFVAGILLSLLLIGVGAYLLRRGGMGDRLFGMMIFVALLIAPVLPFAFLGLWVINAFALVILSLTLMVALGSFIAR